MTDVERLAEAAEVGRKAAAETCAMFHRMQADHERMVTLLQSFGAAQRHVQASGGTGQDVLRMAFEADDTPVAPPRPRLVYSRD